MGWVDGEALVEIYFWDTDFLLNPVSENTSRFKDTFGEMVESDSAQDFSEELEENMLMLEMVDEVAWIIPRPSSFFRTGSTQYPDSKA